MAANNQYNEKKLLSAVIAGDADAFKGIYQHYRGPIFRYILSVVKSPQLAEDLQQEVFAKVWEARGQLPEVASFGSYLFFIARNHTINVMKAAARSHLAMGEILRSYPEPGFDDEILNRDYERFMQRLGQLYRV